MPPPLLKRAPETGPFVARQGLCGTCVVELVSTSTTVPGIVVSLTVPVSVPTW